MSTWYEILSFVRHTGIKNQHDGLGPNANFVDHLSEQRPRYHPGQIHFCISVLTHHNHGSCCQSALLFSEVHDIAL